MANEGVMSLPQEQPMQGAPEGVMSLPQAQVMQNAPFAKKPQIVSSADAYDAAQTAISRINPQQLAQYKAQMRQTIERLNPAPEQVDSMITLFEYLNQHKDQYKEIIAQAIRDGDLSEGDLPPEYNPVIIGIVLLILLELKERQRSTMQPPPGMAGGGIADMAQHLQGRGRHGDNILAHINPEEAELLRQHGGMGTINPYTGLPEFGFLSRIWKGIKEIFRPVTDLAKKIIASPIGRIIATVALTMLLGPAGGMAVGMLGVGVAGTAAIVSGGLTLLGGGSIKEALISGATSYFTAGGGFMGFNPSESIASALPAGTSEWVSRGLTGAAAGTAGGLLSGQSAVDALKSGALAGVAGAAASAGQSYFGAPSTGGATTDATTASPYLSAPDVIGQPIPPIEGVDAQAPPPSSVLGPQYRMVDVGGTGVDMSSDYIPSQHGDWLRHQPGVVTLDNGNLRLPDGTIYAPRGGGWERITAGARAPAANAGAPAAGAGAPAERGWLEKAWDWTRGNAGETDAYWAGKRTDAYKETYTKLINAGIRPGAAHLQAETAAGRVGPGLLATYGPAAGIATLGAMATGLTKPYPVNQSPLFTRQTGAEYIAAHPEIYDRYKGGWSTGATPQSDGSMPTSPPHVVLPMPRIDPSPPQNDGSMPTSPPHVVLPMPRIDPSPPRLPYRPVVGGIPLPPLPYRDDPNVFPPYDSPYVIAGMPTRMYNVGGTVNDPDTSGGNLAPTMTNTFSGGRVSGYAAGGNSPSYPRLNGEINGRGTGISDSIPARLSDGEFVLTAKAVRNAGNGSRREGAKRMYKLMHMLERGVNVKGA